MNDLKVIEYTFFFTVLVIIVWSSVVKGLCDPGSLCDRGTEIVRYYVFETPTNYRNVSNQVFYGSDGNRDNICM